MKIGRYSMKTLMICLGMCCLALSVSAANDYRYFKFYHPDYDSIFVEFEQDGAPVDTIYSAIPVNDSFLTDVAAIAVANVIYVESGTYFRTNSYGFVIPPVPGAVVTDSTYLPVNFNDSLDWDTLKATIWTGADGFTDTIFKVYSVPANDSIYLNLGYNHDYFWEFKQNGQDSVGYMAWIAGGANDTARSFPVASAANTCTVYGTIRDGSGNAVPWAHITATVPKSTKATCDSTLLVRRTVTTRSRVNGYFEIDLVWSSCLSNEKWVIEAKARGFGEAKYNVTVPDSTSYKLFDLVP